MASSAMDGNPELKKVHGDLKHRMDSAVADFQANPASTRTGRARTRMLI